MANPHPPANCAAAEWDELRTGHEHEYNRDMSPRVDTVDDEIRNEISTLALADVEVLPDRGRKSVSSEDCSRSLYMSHYTG